MGGQRSGVTYDGATFSTTKAFSIENARLMLVHLEICDIYRKTLNKILAVYKFSQHALKKIKVIKAGGYFAPKIPAICHSVMLLFSTEKHLFFFFSSITKGLLVAYSLFVRRTHGVVDSSA